MLVLGDHLGHIELVLEPGTGELKLYMLDGHAEHPVRIDAAQLTIEITPTNGVSFVVTASPRENALTGESIGDTSEFGVTDDRLKALQSFKGRISTFGFRGVALEELVFRFPEGNEH